MSSNQATPPEKAAPLSFMKHLSVSVSHFVPVDSEAATPTCGRDPELIVVLGWMGARDVHLAKYIEQHRAMFPSSKILLVRSPASHVFWPPLARKHTAPALPIFKELAVPELEIENTGPSTGKEKIPKILIHIFSNGGVSTAARIYEMLKVELRNEKGKAGERHIIPGYALCLDSCPGNFDMQRTHSALLMSLPRWVSPLVQLFLASSWLFYKLRLVRPAQNLNAEAIRNPSLVSREVRRTYLYGTADAIIDWRQVKDHAARAAASGFQVRQEKFEGGQHVSLARQDGERYWRAVKETWDGGN